LSSWVGERLSSRIERKRRKPERRLIGDRTTVGVGGLRENVGEFYPSKIRRGGSSGRSWGNEDLEKDDRIVPENSGAPTSWDQKKDKPAYQGTTTRDARKQDFRGSGTIRVHRGRQIREGRSGSTAQMGFPAAFIGRGEVWSRAFSKEMMFLPRDAAVQETKKKWR